MTRIVLILAAFVLGFTLVWLATAGAWTHGVQPAPHVQDTMITEAAGDTMITEGGDVMITE